MKKVQFTKEGFEILKREYDDLLENKKPKAIERLGKARAMGDLSENSEYTAAKEDLGFLEGRTKELEEMIKSAEIIKFTGTKGAINIGSKVTVETTKGKEDFYIVGEFEADPLNKKLSHTSPIGSSLIGKKPGDIVEVEVPIGKLKYRIIEVV